MRFRRVLRWTSVASGQRKARRACHSASQAYAPVRASGSLPHSYRVLRTQPRALFTSRGIVTALTAEAASFSGRIARLTRAQPGPGVDVDAPRSRRRRSAPCSGQITVSCRGRVHLAPALVAVDARVGRVSTNTIRRSASSALPARMLAELSQPASRIDLFRPALGGGPVREVGTRLVRVRFRCRTRVIPVMLRSSSAITSQVWTSARAVLWWKSARRLRIRRCTSATFALRPAPVGRSALLAGECLLRGRQFRGGLAGEPADWG